MPKEEEKSTFDGFVVTVLSSIFAICMGSIMVGATVWLISRMF